MAKRNALIRFFGALWSAMDSMRKLMHFFLLAGFVLVLVALFTPTPALVPDHAALVVTPRGEIVDQLAGDAFTRSWDELTGNAVPQTLARDLLLAIDSAAGDERILALVLDLDEMGGAGLSTLRDLGAALQRFRESGKPVIAAGDSYSQAQYYLAAHADEVYLHPLGLVFIQGFGRYQAYFKSAIDNLLVDWNVFKVGEYKSFVEPYLRDDMSPEAKENARAWLSELWASYQADVTSARKLDGEAIARYTQRFPDLLRETGGDLARLAQEAGFVDGLWERDRIVARVLQIPDIEETNGSFRQVSHNDYASAIRVSDTGGTGRAVGVIVASGEIVDGRQPPGTIGGDSTADLIRKARRDDDIAAVVLRVDSGGGSAFASEVILRELDLLRDAGKPLVVSMGDVAASGGYWISMTADEIWASPATITGSIGIGAFFPTFQRSLDWMGVHVDGVGTTPWAGEFRPDRALGERAEEVLQLSIENGYQRFISKVAAARELPVEQVDRVARGRVWTGHDALRLGLVDKLGNLEQALASAVALAGLPSTAAHRYLEHKPKFREALAMQFTIAARRLRGSVESSHSVNRAPLQRLLDMARDELERLSRLNDPNGLYYLCDCRY